LSTSFPPIALSTTDRAIWLSSCGGRRCFCFLAMLSIWRLTRRMSSVSGVAKLYQYPLQKHVARRQDQTFADWFAELRELAGERWADVADQGPTIYAVWGGGATPAQALYMVGLILPPKAAAA